MQQHVVVGEVVIDGIGDWGTRPLSDLRQTSQLTPLVFVWI